MSSQSYSTSALPVSWWSVLFGDNERSRTSSISKVRSRSRSSDRGRTRRAAERTPLLRRITERNEEGSPVEDAHVLAAEVAQQGQGGAPVSPESRKSRSRVYSHGRLVGEAEEGAGSEDAHLVKFQENGLIEGVSKWKFRFVFGGILMGYFVSLICPRHSLKQILLILYRLRCLTPHSWPQVIRSSHLTSMPPIRRLGCQRPFC
jgi:hypothetical protein